MDMVWFGERLREFARDPESVTAAATLSRTDFEAFMTPKVDLEMESLADINHELLARYRDDPTFRDLSLTWLTNHVYVSSQQSV